MSPYLKLENVTLEIPIFDASRSFRKSLLQYCTGGQIIRDPKQSSKVQIRALDNISFEIRAGDRVGLIGHNGSGKTSLLKVLAGVYKPLIGKVTSRGRITPFFSISVGLDGDDTGEENISTIAMYLGMSPKEIKIRKNDIIEFSGLGDFIYLPVRTYSAGMHARLSFAIATALHPEILLMDEGITSVDEQFSEAAKARIEEFYNNLEILVIASHSNDLIRKMCNKAILLEHGRLLAFGKVEEILNMYQRNVHNLTI